jgi:type III secretion protein Q
MSTRLTPVRANLRAIEPARARLQSTLISAFNRRRIDDLRTSARLAVARDRAAATAWIQFTTDRGPVAIAALLVDGTLARTSNAQGQPDGAAAAATLGRIEPLVAALETIIGVALHPAGLVREPVGEMLLIRLDAAGLDGTMRHRLLIGVPPAMEAQPVTTPAMLPGLLTHLRLRWTARIAAPALPAARLEKLGAGDLVLLGPGPLDTRLTLPGRNDHPRARLNLAAGQIILIQDPHERDDIVTDTTDEPNEGIVASLTGTPAVAPQQSAAPPDWGDVRVPATIEFDGGGFTAAELATLGRGSVLPLPAVAGTLAVRVIAGETVVAEGELVAVGEGFGVLVTEVRGPAVGPVGNGEG